MTDPSKLTLAELEAQREAVNAEIEHRKTERAEPDYAAWEPKWQAFQKAIGFGKAPSYRIDGIRALIAAHNTPLAGEWTLWEHGMPVPEGVSLASHEIEFRYSLIDEWQSVGAANPSWIHNYYRYRPRQS